jgi:hypothetical protein
VQVWTIQQGGELADAQLVAQIILKHSMMFPGIIFVRGAGSKRVPCLVPDYFFLHAMLDIVYSSQPAIYLKEASPQHKMPTQGASWEDSIGRNGLQAMQAAKNQCTCPWFWHGQVGTRFQAAHEAQNYAAFGGMRRLVHKLNIYLQQSEQLPCHGLGARLCPDATMHAG